MPLLTNIVVPSGVADTFPEKVPRTCVEVIWVKFNLTFGVVA